MRMKAIVGGAVVAVAAVVAVVLAVVLLSDDGVGNLTSDEHEKLVTLADAAEAAGQARPVLLTYLPVGLQHVPVAGDDPMGRFLMQYFLDSEAVEKDYLAIFLNIYQADYDPSAQTEVGGTCEPSETVRCVDVNDQTVSVELGGVPGRPSYHAQVVVGDQLLDSEIEWEVVVDETPAVVDELVSEFSRALESTKDAP